MTLVPGGSTETGLPEHWKEPYGWPMTGNVDAMWFGLEIATALDVHALFMSGWESFQITTLFGRHKRLWSAEQYRTDKILAAVQRLKPWEWVDELPGGEGSEIYKTQYLGEWKGQRVTVVGPGVNVLYADGTGAFTDKPEPVIREMDGGGHETIRVVPDMNIAFDAGAQLFRVI